LGILVNGYKLLLETVKNQIIFQYERIAQPDQRR